MTALAAPYVPSLTLDDVHAFVVSVSKVEDFNYFTGVGYSYDVDANDVFVYVVARHSYPNAIGQPGGGASGVGATSHGDIVDGVGSSDGAITFSGGWYGVGSIGVE